MTRRFPLPALLALAACGGDAAAGALATRADSAGIEIVTNAAAAWPAGTGWRISPTPAVQVSARDDGDRRYDLLRVSGGRVLPGGDILVAVAGHRELRVYGPDGSWRLTIGREGEGPGEMRSAGNLVLAGDTLFLADNQLRRLSAFRLDGAFLTSWPYPAVEGGGQVLPTARLADGRWLATEFASFTAGQVTAGISRVPVTWRLVSADLAAVEGEVVQLAGTERLISVTSGQGGQVMAMRVMSLPLARATAAVGGPDFLLTGDNDRPELRQYTPGGTLSRIIRWQAASIPVDGALLDRMKAAELRRWEGNAEMVEQIEAMYGTPPTLGAVPAFAGLHRDAEGAIWVREFPVLSTDSIRFRVFGADGQQWGPLALGPRHTVLDIGRDFLLTVWQDDDDLEHIRLYRLER